MSPGGKSSHSRNQHAGSRERFLPDTCNLQHNTLHPRSSCALQDPKMSACKVPDVRYMYRNLCVRLAQSTSTRTRVVGAPLAICGPTE